MIKEECHSFVSFGCQAVTGAVRIGGVQERRRWELVWAWASAGPALSSVIAMLSCHCHRRLFFWLHWATGWCLLGNPDAGHPPTFSHADFVLVFSSPYVPTAVAVNSARCSRAAAADTRWAIWPQHSTRSGLSTGMLTVSSALNALQSKDTCGPYYGSISASNLQRRVKRWMKAKGSGIHSPSICSIQEIA